MLQNIWSMVIFIHLFTHKKSDERKAEVFQNWEWKLPKTYSIFFKVTADKSVEDYKRSLFIPQI